MQINHHANKIDRFLSFKLLFVDWIFYFRNISIYKYVYYIKLNISLLIFVILKHFSRTINEIAISNLKLF